METFKETLKKVKVESEIGITSVTRSFSSDGEFRVDIEFNKLHDVSEFDQDPKLKAYYDSLIQSLQKQNNTTPTVKFYASKRGLISKPREGKKGAVSGEE